MTDSVDAIDAENPSSASRRHSPSESQQILFPYGVGIDTHSEFIQVCLLFQKARGGGGSVERVEREFKTDWKSLVAAKEWSVQRLIKERKLKKGEALRYTIESTGTYHMPVLKAWGGIPSVVNPLLAGPTRRKTDVLDARLLAHHSITGVWKPSFIPTEQAQELRVHWAQRREAVRLATRSSNRINNIILRFGHTFGANNPMRHPESQGLLQDLEAGIVPDAPGVCPTGLPESMRPVVTELHAQMQGAMTTARQAEKAATEFVKSHLWPTGTEPMKGPELLNMLLSVPGVGSATALTWLAEVTDPKRFNRREEVAAFCGCDPSLKISAGKVTSHVRRAGNERLHVALLYAASGLLRRKDDPLGQWGRSIAGRHKKGGHRKACGAVARRIAVGLWHVHRKSEPFSYDGYTLSEKMTVPNQPLDSFLAKRFVTILKQDANIHNTVQLADAYQRGTLAKVDFLGDGTLRKIRDWVIANRSRPARSPISSPAVKSAKKDYFLDPSKVFVPKETNKPEPVRSLRDAMKKDAWKTIEQFKLRKHTHGSKIESHKRRNLARRPDTRRQNHISPAAEV